MRWNRPAGPRGLAASLVVLLAVGALGVACSSSKGTASASSGSGSTTSTAGGAAPTQAAVEKGLQVIIESSDTEKPLTPPAGFLSCTAAKLSPADRVAVARTTSSDKVPADIGVRSIRAGQACNHDFVVAVFKSEFESAGNGIPGITDTEASCVATKGVAAIVALDDRTIGSGTDSTVASGAVGQALDSCYPISQFIGAEMRQSDPGITDAQVACVNTKLGPSVNWASVTNNSDTFQAALTAAATACGAGG
jgi:hypothetical protein